MEGYGKLFKLYRGLGEDRMPLFDGERNSTMAQDSELRVFILHCRYAKSVYQVPPKRLRNPFWLTNPLE